MPPISGGVQNTQGRSSQPDERNVLLLFLGATQSSY